MKLYFLPLFACFLFFSQSLYAQINLNDKLMHYYQLNGNANDASGNNYNGTIMGGVTFVNDRNGNPNSAASFDGTSSYIFVPGPNVIFQWDITFAGWYKTSGDLQLICKSAPGNLVNYRLSATSTNISAITTTYDIGSSTGIPNDLNWHFIVVTYSTLTNKYFCYIDGGLKFTSPPIISPYGLDQINNITIGLDRLGSDKYFNGELDEVRIYSRGVNCEEAYALYSGITTPVVLNASQSPCSTNGQSSITLLPSASNISNYIWSSGASSGNGSGNIINNLPMGDYQITATLSNGCSVSVSQTISASNVPTATIIAPSGICTGTSITINADGGNTYLWNTGANTPNLIINNGGTYSVTSTNSSGCTAVATKTINTYTQPNIPTIQGNNYVCQNQNTTLTALGNNISNYLWSNGSNSQSLNISSSGTYAVTITDNNGCTSSNSLFVESKKPNDQCDDGNPNTQDDKLDINCNCVGVPNSGCTAAVPIISGGNIVCNGQPITLSCSGLNLKSYKWSNGVTGSVFPTNINVTQSGTYTITITDNNGCTNQNTVIVANKSTNDKCDDSNPNTQDDKLDANCNCVGTIISNPKGCIQDSLQLISLYNAANGANWTNKWDLSKPMSTWYGITLNTQGCVTCIDLDGGTSLCSSGDFSQNGNNLVGTLPDLNLPELELLSVFKNKLNGTIPALSKCSKLKNISVGDNLFTGTIPIFNQSNAEYIAVCCNKLTGGIPNQIALNCPKLLGFYAQSNKTLSGALPPDFGNLKNLGAFQLEQNDFSGCFPSSYTNLCKLTKISFIENVKLPYQGNFIEFCKQKTSIGATCDDGDPKTTNDKIDVSCLCKGTLIIDTTSCRYKDSLQLWNWFAANNNPSSPTWKVNWAKGVTLDKWDGIKLNAQGCVLEIGYYDAVKKIFTLDSKNITGTIPDLNLPNLITLYLSNNQLSGNITNFNLPNLKYLYLAYNQLNGSIPNFNLPNLQFLYLDNNQLSGNIPNFNLLNLNRLGLNSNKLSGAIPNFNLPNLQFLYLAYNQLNGSIPNFNLLNLQGLSLDENQLSGNIPNFNLPNLQFLYLGENQLNGNIPNFNLPNLQWLDLRNNQLSGNIPNFNLPNLQYLNLSNNQLNGNIPKFDKLSKLSAMYLFKNNLDGCFDNILNKFCPITPNFTQNPKLPWQGDFQRFCKGEAQIGASCDDGNPKTTNDKIDANCLCKGSGCIATSKNISDKFCEGKIGRAHV